MSFVLVKNSKPVARLEPFDSKRCTGGELAEILKKIQISEEDAKGWRRDLKLARENIKSPADKWQ